MSWEEESLRRQELLRVAVATATRYPHLSIVALSRLYRVAPAHIRQALATAGIERPARSDGDELTPESVAADLAAGLRTVAMARKYDVPEALVRRMLPPESAISREMSEEEDIPVSATFPDPTDTQEDDKQLDLTPYNRRSRRREMPTKEQCEALMAEGLPGRTAALRLGIGYSTWQKLLRRYGLSSSRQSQGTAVSSDADLPNPEPPIATGEVAKPEADETTVRCIRRGLTGEAAKSLLERFSWVPAEDCKYDLQIILREVV